MTLTLVRAPRRAAAAVLAGLVLVPLAGCGGDGSSGAASGDGPARLAPAAAPFYLEATVRPSDETKEDLRSVVGKIAPGKDVGKMLTDLLAKASKGKVTYARDVEPWIGDKAGLAVTSLPTGPGESPDLAAIIDSKDADKAKDALDKTLTGAVTDREYNGVTYRFAAADKTAGGIVDDELVIGTERGFRAVVDASKGQNLAQNGAFVKATDAVADGALGFFYGDLRRVFDLAKSTATGSEDATQFEAARGLFDRLGLKTVAVGLGVTENAIKLRSAAEVKAAGSGSGAADVVAALPGGSFAALGLGDLGKQLSQALDSLSSIPGAGAGITRGLEQLRREAGLDVQKDLLDWMGQTGLFVSGSSITDLGGALVVKSKDPAATKAALSKAETLAAGGKLDPQPVSGNGIDDGFSVSLGGRVQVFAVQAGDRFVLAVNRAALDQALSPTTKLGDNESFKTAAATLGDGLRPSFYVDFRQVSGLLGLALGGQPGFQQVRPYLDAITTIVAGGKRDGTLQRQTLAVGVR